MKNRFKVVSAAYSVALLSRSLGPGARLVRKVRLEALGLLDVERLEVAEPGVGLEPAQSFRDAVERRLAEALGLGQVGEICALDPLVRGVVGFHLALACSLESQFTEGPALSAMRGRGGVNVTSRSPRTASIFARLTSRQMSLSQSGQMPRRLPVRGLVGMHSAIFPAGGLGERQPMQ